MSGAFLLGMAEQLRFWRLAPLLVVLAGCSAPVGLYHDVEGGAIAQARQDPPGADLPYPNLANVPAAPVALTAAQRAQVAQRLNPAAAASAATVANQAAIDGLTLPAVPPPPPNVPGLNIPAVPSPAPAPMAPPVPAAPARPENGPPVALAFAPGSAILGSSQIAAVQALARSRGNGTVLAGGFGEQGAGPKPGALTLAIERARAIADALTAAGVPADKVRLSAGAAGSGGFAQLVY
jgi:hypothetical protein